MFELMGYPTFTKSLLARILCLRGKRVGIRVLSYCSKNTLIFPKESPIIISRIGIRISRPKP